jgi:hypothetical protein
MKHELALVTDSDPISIPDWGGGSIVELFWKEKFSDVKYITDFLCGLKNTLSNNNTFIKKVN